MQIYCLIRTFQCVLYMFSWFNRVFYERYLSNLLSLLKVHSLIVTDTGSSSDFNSYSQVLVFNWCLYLVDVVQKLSIFVWKDTNWMSMFLDWSEVCNAIVTLNARSYVCLKKVFILTFREKLKSQYYSSNQTELFYNIEMYLLKVRAVTSKSDKHECLISQF